MQGKKLLGSKALLAASGMLVIAGCSDDDTTDADGNVTISTIQTLDDGTQFRGDESIDDNVHTEWAEEELDIEFDYLWTRPDDEQYNQQIRLEMSANEELADVFQVGDEQMLADLIESGRIQPIDDAIEEYASPRLKELFDEHEEAFFPSTEDGERYGIPRFSGGNGSDTVLWVRQDWLDDYDVDPPETLSDLEEAMEVFIDEDPGGDTGFGTTNIGDSTFVFGAFGDFAPFHWSEDENGDLVYGSVQDNARDGLEKMNEWYEEGYLASDIGTASEGSAQESFLAGNSGFMTAPPWGWDYPIGDLFENDPDAEVQPYPIPSGDDGQIGRRGENLLTGTFVFSSEFEHMEEYFEYLDAIYGFTFGDDEYFEDGLWEGYDFAYDDDGEPVYSSEEFEDTTGEERLDAGRYMLPTNVPTVPYQMYDILDDFHQDDEPDPDTAYEATLADEEPKYMEAASIVNSQNDIRIEDYNTGPPTETMRDIGESLERMEMEVYADIIYGNEPIEAFDDFVEEWYESGGDQVEEEVNEWYEDSQEDIE